MNENERNAGLSSPSRRQFVGSAAALATAVGVTRERLVHYHGTLWLGVHLGPMHRREQS